MDILLIILAVICLLVGIAGCILPSLPGPPVCYIGLLLARWGGMDINNRLLIIALAVTILVTVLDYYLPIWFTKRFGGSRYATWGSMIGIIAGLFFMPVGLIAGPFIGAFIGELINDSSNIPNALKVAFGSFAAFFFGTGLKIIAAVWMTVCVVKELF